jgi:hypothetical protein
MNEIHNNTLKPYFFTTFKMTLFGNLLDLILTHPINVNNLFVLSLGNNILFIDSELT